MPTEAEYYGALFAAVAVELGKRPRAWLVLQLTASLVARQIERLGEMKAGSKIEDRERRPLAC